MINILKVINSVQFWIILVVGPYEKITTGTNNGGELTI